MIRISHTATITNDKVLRAIQGRLQGLRDNCATAGWHRAEGTRPKTRRGKNGATVSDWRTGVADVALVHETGSYARLIPARPVHRTAFRNRAFRSQLVGVMTREYRELLKGKSAGIVLHNVGSFWRSRFDRVFDGENDWPALADSTVLRRRQAGNWSEQPLVDTRQMRNTTTSKVQPTSAVERPVWDLT
jgi:hypothetical protein